MADDKSTRFWSRVDSSGGPDACWPWTGSRSNGYGSTYYRAPDGVKITRAHRLAHYLTTGEHPPVVMHMCDNPPCCNPAHLRGGTPQDNVTDCKLKGRTRRHKIHYCARGHKYTPDNTSWRIKDGAQCRVCLECKREYNYVYNRTARKFRGATA